MSVEKIIGKAVRDMRKARKISQKELATLADLDRGYLSEIENGHKNFSIQTLKKLADALKVNMADLLMETNSAPSPKSSV